MFTGSMVAIVTPMNTDGSVDWPALEKLVEHHIAQGTDAIVSVGTTGESATLDHNEHTEVIERTVKAVAGRIPVIGGTGANSTSEAILLTERAAAAGVDGCLLVIPYYNKPPQEGLYQHFRTIAEAVAIPQILYNVPRRSACDLLPARSVLRWMAVVRRLAGDDVDCAANINTYLNKHINMQEPNNNNQQHHP